MEAETKPLSASYYKHKGRFDFCSTQSEWQVVLRASNGTTISETWPEDDEPEISGLPPSEVVELIAERLAKYWINTRREAESKKIEWLRERAELIDSGWALNRITGMQKEIDSLQARFVLSADAEAELTAAVATGAA